MASLDHQENYLKSFFGFVGVTQFDIVRAEGLKVSEEVKTQAMAAAFGQIAALQAA